MQVLLQFMAVESWRALEMLEAGHTDQLESDVNPCISSKPTARLERLAAEQVIVCCTTDLAKAFPQLTVNFTLDCFKCVQET